ncbi:hypothetical protein L6164_037299 [Bauhinia variegata]|uniref:Uncharacterized protein n=1 Tax=Bauhinia variegata TaxID=167791 RepID=A0ACB9KJT9_BAUVA|nr:hypothetical protein L6164_037299 [Bauhinia variegata]
MDLPLEIEQLTNLQKLHLDGTQITNLPHSPKWPRLSELFLQDNPRLSELPPLFFDHMPLLQDLNLSSTSIKEPPHSFTFDGAQENLHNLRVCVLGECNKMHATVDGGRSFSGNMLINLEFLGVFYMKNLKSILQGLHSPLCFQRLKSMALHNCPRLTTIFTLDFVNNLDFLEEIVIEDCPKVNTLISHESSKQQERRFLPALRKVSLLYLPQLATISDGLSIGPKLEKIGFYYCPKLKILSTMDLLSDDLKVIKGEAKWWKRLNWSQAGWEQSQVDHLKKIFSPIDEDRDILTHLTTDKDDIVKQDANDAGDNNGEDDDYCDLDDDNVNDIDDDNDDSEDDNDIDDGDDDSENHDEDNDEL